MHNNSCRYLWFRRMHSPTQEPRHVSLAPEQFSRLVRRQVVEMFSPLPIRRSGQEEAVSADLNPVGKPLSNPVATSRTTSHRDVDYHESLASAHFTSRFQTQGHRSMLASGGSRARRRGF